MKTPRFISWIGRKLRAPAWQFKNVVVGIMDHDISHFARRKTAGNEKRMFWLILLTLSVVVEGLLLGFVLVFVAAAAVLVLPVIWSAGKINDIWTAHDFAPTEPQ